MGALPRWVLALTRALYTRFDHRTESYIIDDDAVPAYIRRQRKNKACRGLGFRNYFRSAVFDAAITTWVIEKFLTRDRILPTLNFRVPRARSLSIKTRPIEE